MRKRSPTLPSREAPKSLRGITSGPQKAKARLTEARTNRSRAKTNSFLVVGVGASAGGLEALQQLLGALPPDPEMAFVLIQHLDPEHQSMLVEILSRTVRMSIQEAQDGMTVEPNCVYVIPPNKNMAISAGKLKLTLRPESHGPHLPIDFFLRSLAEDQKGSAIGVILSGNGSDGVVGLAAVKAEGGIAFAQDESSAKFSGMPHAAIASGNVDFVLSPSQISAELMKLMRHPYRSQAGKTATFGSSENGDLNKILALLRNFSRVDFSEYKSPTLHRRIGRRMALHKIEKLSEYAQYLQEHPAELEKLHNDVLINVTSFFRDPAAFEALRKHVLPRIVKNRTPEIPIRIWLPGCSTGEEPYSLAILWLEYLGKIGMNVPLQIFGTDISEASLETARRGIYPENISHNLSPERLRRFFVRAEGGYRVSQSVRDTCVFARHNLFNDPPFSRMDMVCCRNVLIYLGPVLQKRVLPSLHYALKPKGFLFLGASEGVSGFNDLFEAVDKKHKIYAQKPTSARRHHIDFARYPAGAGEAASGARPGKAEKERAPDVQQEADRIVLSNYAPPGVIINGDMDVVQFRGRTSRFLEPAPGKASLNLLRMAKPRLAAVLRLAINRAKKTSAPVRKENIPLQLNGEQGLVDIEVVPIQAASPDDRCFLVLFAERVPAKTEPRVGPPVSKAKLRSGERRELARLERELAETQEALRAATESSEANDEELRSANEEVLSANEELQSTNEELETSQEELQSANEELNTFNEELRNRNQSLAELNSDVNNLLDSISIPVIMLGNDLCIRRFTPTAVKAFNIIAADIGRPITDIKSKLNVPDLERMILQVIDSHTPAEQDVQNLEGHWYSLQVRPYKTLDNKIDGAVLSLIDIDWQKRIGEQQREAKEFAQAIIHTVREPLLVLDSALTVLEANASFYKTFQVSREDTEGKLLFRLGNEQWNIPKLRLLLEQILSISTELYDFEVEHTFPTIGHKVMVLNARRVDESSGSPEPRILLAMEDITERKSSEQALRRNEKLAATGRMAATLAHEINNPLASVINLVYLANSGPAIPESIRRYLTTADEELVRIAEMTKQTLGLYREKTTTTPQPLLVSELLRDLFSILSARAKHKRVQIDLEVVSEVEVSAVGGELRQVFANLLSNSVDAVGLDGRIRVRIAMAPDVGNSRGQGVRVTIADNGAGISSANRAKVFEPFFTTKRDTGTGLGLWVSKEIIENHHGSIRFRSCTEPGKTGTVVSVFLPSSPPLKAVRLA